MKKINTYKVLETLQEKKQKNKHLQGFRNLAGEKTKIIIK
jgi:hypothetical protein